MTKDYKYTINGNIYNVNVEDIKDNIATIIVNGETFKVEIDKDTNKEKPKIKLPPTVTQLSSATPNPTPSNPRAKYQDAVKSPLPGVISEITVSVGDEVHVGDTVVVLEAMKMANNLEAEKSGKVTNILVQAGQSVMEGDPLVIIE